MVHLLDLPTELVRLALSHLANFSIRSFLVSRRACKTFQATIDDILEFSYSHHGLSIHALLTSHFHALLDSASAEPIRYLRPHDNLAPLRSLPWTTTPEIREPWLRPEASWRRLPLASSNGAIVHRLQVVSIWRYYDEVDSVQGCNVMFPLWTLDAAECIAEEDQLPGGKCLNPPRGVTIGWLYDLLVGDQDSLGGGWKVHFETGIGNAVGFADMSRRVGSGLETESEDAIRGMFTPDRGCALLYKPGGWSPEGGEAHGEDVWHPTAIDEYTPIATPFN